MRSSSSSFTGGKIGRGGGFPWSACLGVRGVIETIAGGGGGCTGGGGGVVAARLARRGGLRLGRAGRPGRGRRHDPRVRRRPRASGAAAWDRHAGDAPA